MLQLCSTRVYETKINVMAQLILDLEGKNYLCYFFTMKAHTCT